MISVRGDRTAECEEFVFRHFGGVMAEPGVVRKVMTEQMCGVEKGLEMQGLRKEEAEGLAPGLPRAGVWPGPGSAHGPKLQPS